MKNEVTVLLVDDHAVLRDGYQQLLEAAGFKVIGQASDADEGYHHYNELNPDVSIVDMTMPGAGGMECIRRIRARDPHASILVCSMHDNPTLAMRAMETGASGYISKSSPSSTLIEAVNAIAKGKAFLGNDIANSIALKKIMQPDERISSLSNQEFTIFRMVAEGKSIAEMSESLMLSPKTVSNYKTNMSRKLGTSKLKEIILLAQQAGVID